MDSICLHNEKELLRKVAEGDQASFGTLYDAFHDPLCRFVQKYLKSPDLARDLVHDVFTNLWTKRGDLISVDTFGPYLFTAARNRTLNFLKKASREESLKAAILDHYQPSGAQADYHLLSAEYRQFIQQVLETLPVQTRIVFQLCREEGQSYDAAALQLGISRNAVKKHMMRSHKVFREQLFHHTDIPLALLLLLLRP